MMLEIPESHTSIWESITDVYNLVPVFHLFNQKDTTHSPQTIILEIPEFHTSIRIMNVAD